MNVKKKKTNLFIFLSRFWFLALLATPYCHLGVAFRGKKNLICEVYHFPRQNFLPGPRSFLSSSGLLWWQRNGPPSWVGIIHSPAYFKVKSHINPTSSPSNIHSFRSAFLTMAFVVAEFQNDPRWPMLLYDPLPVSVSKPVNMMRHPLLWWHYSVCQK